MAKIRRQHSPEFEFRVALEAAKGLRTAAQLAQENDIHPLQISHRKRDLLEHGSELFERGVTAKDREQMLRERGLCRKLVGLKLELGVGEKDYDDRSRLSTSRSFASVALPSSSRVPLFVCRRSLLHIDASLPCSCAIRPSLDVAHSECKKSPKKADVVCENPVSQ